MTDNKQTHAAPEGQLLLRTVAMPRDTNPNQDIFGGWIMAHTRATRQETRALALSDTAKDLGEEELVVYLQLAVRGHSLVRMTHLMRRIGRGELRSDVQPLRPDGSRGGTRAHAPARRLRYRR